MEDLSRNFQRNSLAERLRRKRLPSRHWTVLFIGDLGKIVSYRLTRRLLVGFTTCVTVILAVVTYSMVSYNSVRSENRRLRKDLDAVMAKLETAEKTKEKALVSLMALEDGTKGAKAKAGSSSGRKRKGASSKVTKPAATESPETQVSATELRLAEGTSTREREDDETGQPVSRERILVENPEIWFEPDGDVFKFQFSLNNIDREGGRIEGFTFLVLRPDEESDQSHRIFPWSPLKDGKPGVFKRGQYFSIARFKFVRGTLKDVSDIDRFKIATIYVYEDSGDLLVENVFEVAKILRGED